MGKKNALGIVLRESQIAEVVSLIFSGVTIKDACEKTGISDDTFRRWVASSTDYINSIKDLLIAIERLRLITLASADQIILEKLIVDGSAVDTKPGERLQIHRYIHNLLERLSAAQHTAPGLDYGAAQFLKSGPVISRQKSRLAAVDIDEEGSVTVTIPGPGSQQPVLEGRWLEDEQ